MKKKKKVSPLDEYIKANRKGSREAEIENHGRPVSHNRVHVSKKVYNRKRDKADAQRRLPYLCRQVALFTLILLSDIILRVITDGRGWLLPGRQ